MKVVIRDEIVTDDEKIAIGKATLLRALFKAKAEYDRRAGRDTQPGECWAEFESLASKAGLRIPS
jgi:hypothetical protein